MSLSKTLLLGFIAGLTILLGLPLGRLRRPAAGLRAFLNAVAVGVLVFLVWDVFSAAWEPIDAALMRVHAHEGGLGSAIGYGGLFVGGLTTGLVGLARYEHWMTKRAMAPRRFGPGAMAAGELSASSALRQQRASSGAHVALLIAVGIGLHNFAEGLAIGQSAAAGHIALATLLVIGFGLHNATEGFGIVAPLAAEGTADRPSWKFLGALGLIGGGPTFIGAYVGHGFKSDAVSVIFLTLAAGSILYVVAQLLAVAARAKRSDLLAWGLVTGIVAGFLTDAVVTAGGV